MAGGNIESDDVISDINITPMVDVMLCLLVIFMVTTSYVVADSLKIDLPQASTGGPTELTTVMLSLTVDEATGVRKLYLNGDETDEAKVRAHIKNELAADKKDMQAVIAADKRASHGEVIRLIDLVKQEGIIKFALNIQSPAG